MNDAGLQTMTYDDALEVFLATKGSYADGLSNHGPMATEALVHMGAEGWIGAFVESYRRRLEPRDPVPPRSGDWRELLRTALPGLVGAAAVEAGHGLLRVAHAVRGIERAEQTGAVPDVRLAELRAALGYWRAGGPGLPAPTRLDGSLPPEEWLAALRPPASFDVMPGLLTGTLARAASQDGFTQAAAALQPTADAAATLDDLAILAAAGYLRNDEFLSWFALLHGVTVSTMARALLPHLDPPQQHRLVAAVAGFVAAAIVGFDRPAGDRPPLPPVSAELADRAAATLDDHTIKFTDACLGLAARTGLDLPLHAAERQIARTSGPPS